MPKTRHSSGDAERAVGGAASLPEAELPLLKEIFARAKQIKETYSSSPTNQISNKDLIDKIYEEVLAIYLKVNSNLPLVSEKWGRDRLKLLYEKYKNLVKSGSTATSPKMIEFQRKLDRIFDLVACKCEIKTCQEVSCEGCENKAHITCNCKKHTKIPVKELHYVLDQRNRIGVKGNLQLGNPDRIEMARMDKNKLKKSKNKAALNDGESEKANKIEIDFEEAIVDDDNDDNFNLQENVQQAQEFKAKQNRTKLRNAAKECVRWNISPRGGAAIITAALVDFGIVSKDDTTNVVDKNKLRREIEAYENELKEEQMLELQIAKPGGFWFDGKKDDSLVVVSDDQGKKKNVVKKEEHVSVISQPGGLYVTHLTPAGGKGVEIAKDLTSFLEQYELVVSWDVIGADSTTVNTGNKGGVLATVEKITGKRKMWQICQLHLNELPLRHVFTEIDGETDSKNTFKGKIGKILPHVEEFDLLNQFPKVDVGEALPDLSDEVVADLSSDQFMLFLAWDSVKSGKLRKELLSLTPGPISHSRWLTLALRILLLYMTKHKLTGKHKKNLHMLVSFLMTNYIPMWFTIKRIGKLESSAQILYKQMELIKLLNDPVASIAKKNVERNAYAAQSETLLTCMLCDDDSTARAIAVEKIIALREGSEYGDTSVRLFEIPGLRFDSSQYYHMIDWSKEKIYEPVLTCGLSLAELEGIKSLPLSIPKYPNHAQACERQVKQTSIAAMQVAGYSSRDGYIRASASSRKLMGKFESKKDFAKNFV